MTDITFTDGNLPNTAAQAAPTSSDDKLHTENHHDDLTELEAFSRSPTTEERLNTQSTKQLNQKINPAQAIAQQALRDGSLSLDEANQIYNANTDPNFELTVDAAKLSVYPQGEMPSNGSVTARVIGLGDWLVHGNISLTSLNEKLSINPELYDFDYKPGISKIPRNIETLIGEVVAGYGVPFKINFDGSPSIFAPETDENIYP
jgi:hypothetical protein